MHKKLLSFIIILSAAAFIFSGCAKQSITILKEYDAKPEDCEIEVITIPPVDKKFEEVAILNAKGGQTIFHSKKSEGLIEQLKKDACSVGADAIIIRSTEDGSYNWGQGGFDRSKAAAIAIRWIEE